MTNVNFTVLHADHGITSMQIAYIKGRVQDKKGFFIQQVEIPSELGTVPCALYGPSMDDDDVPEHVVDYQTRGDREWTDRMVEGYPERPVSYVQVIGMMEDTECTLFTVYGGPLAPQNPKDPTLDPSRKQEATDFWAAHALCWN